MSEQVQHNNPETMPLDADSSRFAGRAIMSRIIPDRWQRKPETITLSAEDTALAEKFEADHFVAEAPLLSEIADDETRTNPYKYRIDTSSTRMREKYGTLGPLETRNLTEHQGLLETRAFLSDMAQKPEVADKATKILNGMNFIGERELDEATKGIAAHWKSYLTADPKQKLCVPSGASRTGEPITKSSDYLFGRVMEHFTPEELETFGGRISKDLDSIGRKHKDTRVILLDDWAISGVQLDRGHSGVLMSRYGLDLQDSLEVNLVAASANQLETPNVQGRPVPTYAYYKCNSEFKEPRITGIHSSVDFGFEKEIEKMVQTVNDDAAEPVNMPPLTNIVRTYR